MFALTPILLLSLQAPTLPEQDLVDQLCPERYVHETEGWAVQLDRKWIQIDKVNIARLEELAASKPAKMPKGAENLLMHLEEMRSWQRLPRFVPVQKRGSLTPIGAFGARVDTNPSGSYTRQGFENHQDKIAESVRGSAAFFNREGESERVEHELVEIDGARTLRVLVSTVFPDKGAWFLESWTLPGHKRYFTVSMLYPKEYREICGLTLRSFLDGFEGIVESKAPGHGKKLQLSWGLIFVFLLPFLVVPILFFRNYKRPGPPRA